MTLICCYQDFVNDLLHCGMTIGGTNNEGVFSLCDRFTQEIRWHTEEADTDPWEWRMRVLDERKDIAYGKVFFKKSGYITEQWYPYFLAVRRGMRTVQQEIAEGTLPEETARIYRLVQENGVLPLHLIKEFGLFGKEEKARFEQAITALQMKCYLTMCGKQRKESRHGEEYGWSSTVFCTTEHFWGNSVFEQAAKMKEEEAYRAIAAQLATLNPEANPKKLAKMIRG